MDKFTVVERALRVAKEMAKPNLSNERFCELQAQLRELLGCRHDWANSSNTLSAMPWLEQAMARLGSRERKLKRELHRRMSLFNERKREARGQAIRTCGRSWDTGYEYLNHRPFGPEQEEIFGVKRED